MEELLYVSYTISYTELYLSSIMTFSSAAPLSTLCSDAAVTNNLLIWHSDKSGSPIFFNSVWQKIFGTTPTTIKEWRTFIHRDDVESYFDSLHQHHQHPKSVTLSYRLNHPDAQDLWLQELITPRKNKRDTFVGLTGVAMCISHQKKWSEAVKQDEEKYRLLLESTSDCIMLVSEEGTVLYQNTAIFSQLGYSSQSRFGKNFLQDSLAHPEDREKEHDFFTNILKNESSELKTEYRLLSQSGASKFFSVQARNLISHPAIQGVVLQYRNITQRKENESQKDAFLGVVSHELKTPVTSLKAYTQALFKRFKLEGDNYAAEQLNKMLYQINRLSSLIGDLLDTTKIESGKLKLHTEDFSLTQLVSDTIDELQLTTDQHRLYFTYDTEKTVSGDSERIKQVLNNLITNAIKYSPSSTDVFVSQTSSSSEVTISVTDQGVGIPEHVLPEIFERFFRVEQTGCETISGLGLGLFISKEIIERHSGRIWVESTLHAGSTFSFSLPLPK